MNIRDFVHLLKRPQQYFLIIGGLLTLSFVFLTPPFQVPDETAHFTKSFAISTGQFTQQNGGNSSGVKVPLAIYEYFDANALNQDKTYNYKRNFSNSVDISIKNSKNTFQEIPNLAPYSFVAYLPQSLGIFIANLFTDRVAILFYAARLANAAVFICLIWLAIRSIALGKWALTATALLPMSLFLAASVSADALTLGTAALFTAALVNIYITPRVTQKQALLLILSAAVLALSKQAYIVLTAGSLIILLKPQRNFALIANQELRKRFIIIGLVFGIAGLTFTTWQLVNNASSNMVSAQRAAGLNVNPDMQVSTIENHPTRFIEVFTNTFFGDSQKDIIWSFFGNFGWLDRPLSFALVAGLAVCLIFIFGLRNKDAQMYLWPSLTLIVLSLITFAGILVGLYVLWTPVDSEKILGFQGRYLIPLLMFCVPALVGRYVHSVRVRYVIGAYTTLVAISVFSVLATY